MSEKAFSSMVQTSPFTLLQKVSFVLPVPYNGPHWWCYLSASYSLDPYVCLPLASVSGAYYFGWSVCLSKCLLWLNNDISIGVVGSQGSFLVRVPNSWLEGCEFKSWQERREDFLLQSQPCVLTHARRPFHPRVTAVVRKRSWSFCQKCRWQVTPKHAYTFDPLKSEWADYAAVQAKCGNLSGN